MGAAARLGYADVVQWLLTNVHASGRQYSAAVEEGLVSASERGHVEVVRVLCGMTVRGDLGRAVEMAAGAGMWMCWRYCWIGGCRGCI